MATTATLAAGAVSGRGIADPEPIADSGADPPPGKILAGRGGSRCFHQIATVDGGTPVVDREHGLTFSGQFFLSRRARLLRQGNLVSGGKLLQGGGKVEVVVLHHEGEDIAGLAAAETVEELPPRMHRERWRFLTMKRTQAKESGTAFFQIDTLTDNLDDIRLVLDPGRNVIPGFLKFHFVIQNGW